MKSGIHHENATRIQVVRPVWNWCWCKSSPEFTIVYAMWCPNITGSSTLYLDSWYVLGLQLTAIGLEKDVHWTNQMITRSSVLAIISPILLFSCKLLKMRFVVNNLHTKSGHKHFCLMKNNLHSRDDMAESYDLFATRNLIRGTHRVHTKYMANIQTLLLRL